MLTEVEVLGLGAGGLLGLLEVKYLGHCKHNFFIFHPFIPQQKGFFVKAELFTEFLSKATKVQGLSLP